MSKKPELQRYVDRDGRIHAVGGILGVAAGLCGNDDWQAEADLVIDCSACRDVIDHVHKHRRPA